MDIAINHALANSKELTILDLVREQAERCPDQVAYTFWHVKNKYDELTFAELYLRAQGIASHLQHLDVFGKRALLLYPSGLDFIVAFIGVLYAGVVAVPAYPPRRDQSLDRLRAMATNVKASIVLTTVELKKKLQPRVEDELNILPDRWLATDILSTDNVDDWQRPAITSRSLALLQYTSGSTGAPKGVMISHGNLWHNSEMIYHEFGHSSHSRGMIWLPPYHDMGLIGGVLQPLYGGFPVMLMSPMDFLQKPFRWLQAISEFRATTSGGPNFAYELCCRKVSQAQLETLDLSCWDVAFTGAEPIHLDTLNLFTEKFASRGFRPAAFYPCYGMAESTLMVTGSEKHTPPKVVWVDSTALEDHIVNLQDNSYTTAKPVVSCGSISRNQQVIIVNPDTQVVSSGNQVGEIWVKSSSVASGYWGNSKLTQTTFQAYRQDTGDGPFLRTGDLGFILDEQLFITGRIKDIIIIRGQNHYPQDIESTVEKSHSILRLSFSAAFAIEQAHSEGLVIVQEIERSSLKRVDTKAVIAAIRRDIIANHTVKPYAIVLVKPGSILKTSSGKIRRRACRTAFLTRTLAVVDDWCERPEYTHKYESLEANIESLFQCISGSNNPTS
ncbi:MAG: fatty acyl-AMP ligase [Cyanobacteria bacterium P01_F01_bin.116]